MECRVCKRELDSPVCSFCGEDNSDYIDVQNNEEVFLPKDEAEKETEQPTAKKIKKYRIDYKKLAALIGIVIVIVAAVIIVVNRLGAKGDDTASKGNTLFDSGMLGVYESGEWGYVSDDGTKSYIIEPQFRNISAFWQDRAFVLIGEKYAMIDKNGSLLTEPRFESYIIPGEDDSPIPVMEDGKWGYIKADGSFSISPKFSSAAPFVYDVAAVSVSDAYGYIGKDGEYRVAPQYDMALDFSADGLAAIKTDGKWGYIDKEGNAVIEPRFEKAHTFKDGLASVMLYGSYAMIDKEGKLVIAPQFDSYFSFDKDGYALVKAGTRYGVIDKEGNFIIAPVFADMGSFGGSSLTYAARGDGLYGFVDKTGTFVIEPQFEDAGNFSNGLAPVKLDGLWGYINEEGEYVLDPRFLSASAYYDDGYAVVLDALGKTVIIDLEGNSILDPSLNPGAVMSK